MSQITEYFDTLNKWHQVVQTIFLGGGIWGHKHLNFLQQPFSATGDAHFYVSKYMHKLKNLNLKVQREFDKVICKN